MFWVSSIQITIVAIDPRYSRRPYFSTDLYTGLWPVGGPALEGGLMAIA